MNIPIDKTQIAVTNFMLSNYFIMSKIVIAIKFAKKKMLFKIVIVN